MFRKILIILFKTKFVFTRPTKKKFLFIDFTHCEIIIKKFKLKEKDFNILFSRLEKINIPILIKSILKNNLNVNFANYCYEYLKITKPKKVITFIDNNILFYKLKKKFPSTKFISVQNGHRTQYRDFFSILEKNKHLNLECDKIFIANLGFGKMIKKFIKCEVVPLGFFKNNFVKLKKQKTLKKSLLFLSQFRENQTQEDFFLVEKKLLKFLADFCLKNKLNLYILGCSENFIKEKKYYQSILMNYKYNFQKKLKYPLNYKLVDKFNIIVFVDSTLGYESISRGKKVAAFSSRKKTVKGGLEKFGWPNKFKDIGFFHCSNEFKKIEAEKIMTNVININQNKWNKFVRPKLKSISIYNYNNKPLFREFNN